MITDDTFYDMAERLADDYDYDKHGDIRAITFTPAQFLKYSRELIALAQQAQKEPAQAVPQHVIEASNRIPQNVIETPQSVPYGWHVTGLSCLMVGEYAEHDAKAVAKRCGGTPKAIPLYTAPPAIDDETRKMVLELCRNVMQNVASWSLADDAETILERLEAGE